jgi:hypothetical protein
MSADARLGFHRYVYLGIDEAAIGAAMTENLRLLYPIYDFMAWHPGRR